MSWESLAPMVVSTGRPMVSATVRRLKDDSVKVRLNFSAFVQDDFGDPKRVGVSIGTGEDDGKLRLVFGDGGAFEAKPFGKGGFGVTLPRVPGCPERDHGPETCRILSQDTAAGELVLAMPLEAWGRAAQLALPAPTAADPTRPAAIPSVAPSGPVARLTVETGGGSGPIGPGRPLDAQDYLLGKGFKVSRTDGAHGGVVWHQDGDVVTKGVIVKLVNRCRAAAGLDALSPDCVR